MNQQGDERIRAGWTGPVAVLALGVMVLGWRRAASVSETRAVCHVASDLEGLAQSLVPTAAAKLSSCSGVDQRYDVGLALAFAGVVLALTAVIVMYRRARASRRAGFPWWPRRSAERIAAWIDAPGSAARPPDRPLRVRPNAVMAVGVLLVLGVVELGNVVRQDVQRSLDRHALHRGEAALTVLSLPASLIAGDSPVCHSSIDTRCAESDLSPTSVALILERLLDGKPDIGLCEILPPPAGTPCEIEGTVGGYHALAFAFPKVHFRTDGSPSVGGTNVTIELLKASSETHVG
ncbi:MAG TPA: hypothetical protein VHV76_03750 [Mycobacteriales bacterium]|nr:hypothetical protein [Mycobacteriales bacterium]